MLYFPIPRLEVGKLSVRNPDAGTTVLRCIQLPPRRRQRQLTLPQVLQPCRSLRADPHDHIPIPNSSHHVRLEQRRMITNPVGFSGFDSAP